MSKYYKETMVDFVVNHKDELVTQADDLTIYQGPYSDASPKLTLDSFDLHRIIGTFSKVRIVTCKNSNGSHPYALKCLSKFRIIQTKQLEHVWNEKSILTEVDHPFIIKLFATFQDEDFVYLVTDYAAGGELYARLSSMGTFSSDIARFYAAELILAIDYLHGLNIAYRDIKPENILLDSQGHVKLTDFGFAKRVSQRTSTLCGTPEYLAPEIVKREDYGKEVDIWAIGVLLFEMLTGLPPFIANSPYEIFHKIVSEKLVYPAHITRETQELIEKCLEKDSRNRIKLSELKSHKWFGSINFEKLYKKDVIPPWLPLLSSDRDTRYFEQYPDIRIQTGCKNWSVNDFEGF